MFSDRFAHKIAQAALPFLQHRCKLIRYEPVLDVDDDPVLDENGHPTYTEDETENVRCLFLWREVSETDEEGTRLTKIPTLYLEAALEVSEQDMVRDVTNRNGTVTLLTSGKINTIDTTAEGGNQSLKVCQLEGATL